MGWKFPVIFLGALAVLGLTVWVASLCLDALLETQHQECLAIQTTIPVDDSPRPAILGPEEAGQIWELLLPAFTGVEALDEYDNIDNFDAHGVMGDTPRLIDAAGPSLDLCRRAARRRDSIWRGASSPQLPHRAERVVRALGSKGILLWREGRDAEAVEWLLTALAVAYDTVRRSGNWALLGKAERWALEDFRSILEEQELSAVQLEDLGRRLDLLRSVRPPFVDRLRREGATKRLQILEGDVWVSDGDSANSDVGPLGQKAGWRDCWSLRFAQARILKDIRLCGRELEGVSWQDPQVAPIEAERILDTYTGRFVRPLLPYLNSFQEQAGELWGLDILQVAVGCARFQALQGRLPKTWAESGIALPLTRGIDLEDDRLSIPGTANAFPYGQIRLAGEWLIGRRK